MQVTAITALIFLCGVHFTAGQQQVQKSSTTGYGNNDIFVPMMKMLASLVQPNPLLQNRSIEPQAHAVRSVRVTASPDETQPQRLSQQPLSIFNWFMSPMRLAVIMKKYEFQPMNLPRNDDSFFFDTKRDWGLAFGLTCACLAPVMLAFNVWTYYELKPFKLPRHPTDQSTWISRWIAGEKRGALTS